MKTAKKYPQAVVQADYLYDYLIELTFYDGTVRVVDLEDFFTTTKFGLVRKFAPLEMFKQYRVEEGTLCWGDNECDINPFNLYEGKYDAQLEYA